MSFGSKRACYKCGNIGHFAHQCTADSRLCYNCKLPGHESHSCPSPRSAIHKQCYLCHEIGHVQADCRHRQYQQHQHNRDFTTSSSSQQQQQNPISSFQIDESYTTVVPESSSVVDPASQRAATSSSNNASIDEESNDNVATRPDAAQASDNGTSSVDNNNNNNNNTFRDYSKNRHPQSNFRQIASNGHYPNYVGGYQQFHSTPVVATSPYFFYIPTNPGNINDIDQRVASYHPTTGHNHRLATSYVMPAHQPTGQQQFVPMSYPSQPQAPQQQHHHHHHPYMYQTIPPYNISASSSRQHQPQPPPPSSAYYYPHPVIPGQASSSQPYTTPSPQYPYQPVYHQQQQQQQYHSINSMNYYEGLPKRNRASSSALVPMIAKLDLNDTGNNNNKQPSKVQELESKDENNIKEAHNTDLQKLKKDDSASSSSSISGRSSLSTISTTPPSSIHGDSSDDSSKTIKPCSSIERASNNVTPIIK